MCFLKSECRKSELKCNPKLIFQTQDETTLMTGESTRTVNGATQVESEEGEEGDNLQVDKQKENVVPGETNREVEELRREGDEKRNKSEELPLSVSCKAKTCIETQL